MNLKRKHVFWGRWVKHGGRYPLSAPGTHLATWRRPDRTALDGRTRMLLKHGQTVTFQGGFSDVNLNDLTFFTDKHNKYATREAVDVINQQARLSSDAMLI
ncbi:hypothetical protein ACRAWD_22115 [Caulobacter segnis]